MPMYLSKLLQILDMNILLKEILISYLLIISTSLYLSIVGCIIIFLITTLHIINITGLGLLHLSMIMADLMEVHIVITHMAMENITMTQILKWAIDPKRKNIKNINQIL